MNLLQKGSIYISRRTVGDGLIKVEKSPLIKRGRTGLKTAPDEKAL